MKLVERRMTRAEFLDLQDKDWEAAQKLKRRTVRSASSLACVAVLTPDLAMLRDEVEKWAREIAKTAPAGLVLNDLDGLASRLDVSHRSAGFQISFYVRGDDEASKP